MALRISLRDGDKLVVNGAVLRSVGRSEICVESNAAILRGREIMSPGEADTPAKQLYFHTMMAYIDADGRDAHQDRVVESLGRVVALLPTPDARAAAVSFAQHAASMQHYRALGDCRTLIRLEEAALAAADQEAA